MGSVLEHCNKVSYNLFTGGGACLQFVKIVTSKKFKKAKHDKTRYLYICVIIWLKNNLNSYQSYILSINIYKILLCSVSHMYLPNIH